MIVLIGLVGLTIVLGDRVGVTLERMTPTGVARSTASIIIQFSEAMNRDSVATRLHVAQIPPEKAGAELQNRDTLAQVSGAVSWNGSTLMFRPTTAFKPGAAYEVMLAAGATSDTGRQVLSDYHYAFTVRSPRVAYLAPSDNVPRNIWVVDAANPSSPRQLTFSPSGIDDFAVSPDGSQIAFSEENSTTGTKDIKVLDLDSGGIEQVTNCQDAECKTPVWRPDGQTIAYERVDYNSDLSQQVGKASPTRIWLIDLSTRPATTRPMFSDSQTLGYGLDWSADGQRATLFDRNSQGILMYDFRNNTSTVIPTIYGNPGQLSPDGTRLVFPEVVFEESQTRSYLQIVDLKEKTIIPLTNPADPIDDDAARWSPDGRYLVIARRYVDERYTSGKQLYKLNPADGSVQPLLIDPTYGNGFFSFDPTGTQLVIQRFLETSDANEDNLGLPGIWTLDIESGTLTKVAENALFGRWIP
jgi:Tol biopolymer transport system component